MLKACIELTANRLVDELPGRPAQMTAVCLDLLLLEGHAAWQALCPRCCTVVVFAGHCHVYELVSRLFMKALKNFGATHQLVASWLPSSIVGETNLVMDDLSMRWG